MIDRNLKIALLLSLSVHIVSISVFAIISPESMKVRKPYTKVTFLGPLLNKTAFDIMLENVKPVFKTTYRHAMSTPDSNYLDICVEKYQSKIEDVPRLFSEYNDKIIYYLKGSKSIPGFDPEKTYLMNSFNGVPERAKRERKIVHKPEMPLIMKGRYGDKDFFIISVRVQIDVEGNVKAAEPLTTTGYPQLDMDAVEYVNGWLFESKSDLSVQHEWQEIDVVLSIEE